MLAVVAIASIMVLLDPREQVHGLAVDIVASLALEIIGLGALTSDANGSSLYFSMYY